MRPVGCFLWIASLILSACANPSPAQQSTPDWKTGFWFWSDDYTESMWTPQTVDSLYLRAGQYDGIPRSLPAAREYWIVYRYELRDPPGRPVLELLAKQIPEYRAKLQQRKLPVAGLQLDVDCPTGSLREYAHFLAELRKVLPPGMEISITALLDWFRDGTSVADVIDEVDEFVPQFYDLQDADRWRGSEYSIAGKIDGARWGPVFNRFGKRFRVGISTFGRASVVRVPDPSGRSYYDYGFVRGVTPMDLATRPVFRLDASRNDVGELVLGYRATRDTEVGYSEFGAGDVVQFTLATPETVRAAVDAARKMGGRMAGVVFFRWPTTDETLVMQPAEVLAAAGLGGAAETRHAIHAVDGGCAAVACVDLFLESANPFAARPLRFRIRSSTALEYFLPEENVPIRMTGPSELELSLPPYGGQGRTYLGRAVTVEAAEYTLELDG